MEDNQIDRIFSGNFEQLPPIKHPLVRIYLSSTYTDMTLEKTVLVSEVFPKLKEYCRERHGLEFQVVDMRWGVRDEATDDHLTTSICLEEINNCRTVSIGPNFIFLGGQKYGYRPIPNIIDCYEFDAILQQLIDLDREDTHLLTLWYAKDTNAIPPVMVLKPISSILPNFLNKLIPEKQEEDQQKWWETLCKLQKLLRDATTYLARSGKIHDECVKKYQMSVIERECDFGMLTTENTKGSCLAFMRKISNLNLSDNRGEGEGRKPTHYVDLIGKQIDHDAMKLIDDLCDRKIPAKLEASNIRRYEVEWVGMSGLSMESFNLYMREFVFDFYKNVIRLIDKSMKRNDHSVRGNMASEIHKHMDLALETCSKFLGRDDELDRIKTYLLGSLRRAFLVYGLTGTGKTSFIGKISAEAREWVQSYNPNYGKNMVLVVRFLGTTPQSSAIDSTLMSICQQLCYNLEIPIEEIPSDFVPLKNYFKILLDTASEKNMFTIILLDSLELFFLNSHQNGATSWIPKELPINTKIIITFTMDYEENVQEKEAFLKSFSEGLAENCNLLQIGELGNKLASEVLRFWMDHEKRTLVNHQWRMAMNAFDRCSMALFVQLVFSQIKHWKSYNLPEETELPYSIQQCITDLFGHIEKKFGEVLVSHAVSYITASKSGLSENELEDILCLDEEVLQDVFRFQIPQVRRIPPILWTKIRRELQEYFTEHEADGARVIVWAHKQFRDVAADRFLKDSTMSVYLHSTMSDFFLGTWSGGIEKPFVYTELHRQRFHITDKQSRADRKVPAQPNVFIGNDGKVSRYNLRKFGELPYHLIGSYRITDLCEYVLFNYHWLHAKISAVPIGNVLEDFERAIPIVEDPHLKRQIVLVFGALQLSRTVLDKFPDMLSAHLVGRLLPEIRHYQDVRRLVQQCDVEGLLHNCLVPLKHYLPCPGGPLKYTLEGHRFAIFGCSLTNDRRYVVSISNRFISWDVATSEVCRDIDPRTDGIMLGMCLTSDNRFAAAFTSSGQLVIVDIMLGHYIRVEKPMEKDDEIIDITMTDKHVILYNNKYYRTFDFGGKHVGEVKYDLTVSEDILELKFCHETFYIMLMWTGDIDLEDTRLWLSTSLRGQKSEPLMVYNSVQVVKFEENEVVFFGCQKSEASLKAQYMGKTAALKWTIIRYHIDPTCEKDLPYLIVVDDTEEIFGFRYHCAQGNRKVLTAAQPEGFLLVYDPMEKGDHFETKKLRLPRSVLNIRVKLNHSNPCIFAKNGQMMIAGVRRDIFMWDVPSEKLLRSFNGHSGRIMEMQGLSERGFSLFITSSIDRTIKVWDVEHSLEVLHPLDKMDLSIVKVILCSKLNTIVALTRNTVSFWSLETGQLDQVISETPNGGYISDVVVTSNGRFFVTGESELHLIWNMPSRVVLFKDSQPNIIQLLLMGDSPDADMSSDKPSCFVVAVSHVTVTTKEKTGLYYRVIGRNITNGAKMYKFEVPVGDHKFQVQHSGDKSFLMIYGVEKLKSKDTIFVYHARRGVFLHKIVLKYPHIKRPLKFQPYSDYFAVVVDTEKANIIDIRNKMFVRSIARWTGQSTTDYRFGLSAHNSGGLVYLDLRSGKTIRNVIDKVAEGVFTVECDFSRCGEYIVYYHNGRRTIRLFKRDSLQTDDFRPLANYCLHTEATSIQTTEDGKKLVVGGRDGSVTILVICDISEENLNKTRKYLKGLASRQLGGSSQGSETSDLSLKEKRQQRLTKLQEESRSRAIIRFRAIARVALYMDQLVKRYKQQSVGRGFKKTQSKQNCYVS